MIAYLMLGLLVLVYGQEVVKNRLMFSMSFFAILWTYSVMMIFLSGDYPGILLWARVSFAAAVMIPWHVYALALSFRESKSLHGKRKVVLLFFSLLSALSCLTLFMIESIQEPLMMKVPRFGLLAYPYYAYHYSEKYWTFTDSHSIIPLRVR